MYKLIALTGLLALFITGCINFQYKGAEFTPTKKANIYESAKKIPDQKYLLMGKCVASGRYSDVTREKMYRRLQEEAESKGADAVLITSYQIVPTGFSEEGLLGEDSVSLWSEGSVTNSGWNQLYSDFDQYYGQIGKKEQQSSTPLSYTRIIRAAFVKYDKNLPEDFDMLAFKKRWTTWSKKLKKFKQPKTFKAPPPRPKKDPNVVNFRGMD
jgi:hypothetical protein